MKAKRLRLHGLEGSLTKDHKRRWKLRDAEGIFGLDYSLESIPFSRFYIFYIAAVVVLLVFLARLFTLNIIFGSTNREFSENNRVRLVESEAPRGNIYDRNGILLAQSTKSYVLSKDGGEVTITKEQADELERAGLAGSDYVGELGQIKEVVNRVYPLGFEAAHLLGYTSKVTGADLEKDPNISKVNAVGRLGVEQAYDDFLVGKPARKLIEVDALEKKVSILGKEEAIEGRNVHTAIDSGLQRTAFESLKNQVEKLDTKKAAVVVQNPNTGEVLALGSTPSFDPQDIGRAVTDLDQPFFNRAIQGVYPPGSVFKPSVVMAGLESGKISTDFEVEDVGQFEVAGTKFSNWFFTQYGRTDGNVGIEKAIARSNDIFFYRAAEKIGLFDLHKMAVNLGYGQVTGIDLPGEAFGLVPDEVWKESTLGEDWYLGDTMHMGIGQGFLLTTPIQVNRMTSYIASGKLTKPHVVSKIEAEPGQKEINFGTTTVAEGFVDGKFLDMVRSGMRQACQTGGTGAVFFNAGYSVGCKTGTAEKSLGNPHAWFTAYAPFDAPEVAITVIIENGGEGSKVAGPVAKEILDWWMKDRN